MSSVRTDSPTVIIIGDIAQDYTVEVDDQGSLDEKVKVVRSVRSLGGTAANSASQVVALGGQAVLISSVGDDPTGFWLLQKAEEAGIGVSSVSQKNGLSTTATIVLSASERTVYVDLGVAEDIEIDDWALLESADLVYVSYAPQLVEALISRGVGPRLIVGLEQWMASPAVLKACESCLLVVTNEAGANAFNISELPAVVVTRGAAGVELRNRGVMVDFIPATSVNTLDSTGAGDSFAGALCYSLAIGSNLAISLRFATTTAALSTLSRGAQAALPSLEQVTAKMAENGANEVAANLV